MLSSFSKFLFSVLLVIGAVTRAASNPPTLEFKSIPASALGSSAKPKIEDLKGKVVVVDFWASWCAPCKEALPHYNKLYEKYKDQGVVFIGVNEDDDIKERDAYLKNEKILFTVLADLDKQMAKDFQVVALPTLFVFDKKLKPVTLYRGFDDKKPQVLEEKIKELLKQK